MCSSDLQENWLSCFLRAFEVEKWIADPGARMPEAVKKRGADTGLKNHILFTSILEEYVTVGRKLNGEQKKNVAEGNILRDIQDVCAEATLAAATPMVVADATCGKTPAGVVNMLITCETTRATILVATEIESSSRGQDNFQLEDKMDMEIEYIKRLMMRVTQE